VLSVAGQALRTAENRDRPGEIAVARVLAQSGTWIVLHGACLVSADSRRVAVIIEPAHPARISSLLMSAYGLTGREQEVTRHVLQGSSTAQIADELGPLAAHRAATPQQRLRQDRCPQPTGPRREDLLRALRTRLRDNERRAINGKPLRGEPLDGERVLRSGQMTARSG
jgi:hypothetical protein